jgi:transposase
VGVERRQVFDLPPMTVRVTEHQLITRRCACGATTCGAAQEGVRSPAQYGPQVTAIIRYLYVGQFLSKKRTAQALAELFGTPVSEGTVATMTRRAADGLAGFLTHVRDRVAAAEVAVSMRPVCGWRARCTTRGPRTTPTPTTSGSLPTGEYRLTTTARNATSA